MVKEYDGEVTRTISAKDWDRQTKLWYANRYKPKTASVVIVTTYGLAQSRFLQSEHVFTMSDGPKLFVKMVSS
ncbi:hypothetical protein Daus18300_004187 [Diaporthe australafricana]|uniref:Uncharacterized protein n=1 Tax=Diaporthe australafricana TaxID=127596 RepID=A0ABR3XBJ1_9PEZI